MKKKEYNKWYLVLVIFAVIFMFFGGTLAYFRWTTNTEQRTNIILTVEPTFMCEADGGGDLTSEDISLVPTDCTNQEYAIQREIKVSPTIYGETSITMDLWLDIKSIGSGLRNSNNFKYALTTDPNSCTNGLVKSGNFKDKNVNDKVELFSYMGYNQTTTDTYYLYVWLDKAETNSNTMNQSFSLSLNGMCTDAPEPETYIVFNEEDTTLRLYKRDGNVSDVSNNNQNKNIVNTLDNRMNNYNIDKVDDLTITEEDKITFDLENTTYSSAEQLPWYEYRENITRVIFEDEIKPKSMAYWFSGMTNVEYIDVSKIDTIKITNMNGIFSDVGLNVTDSFEIVGLNNWNVSNVTNMGSMFSNVGENATSWDIGDLSGWNIFNVTDMGYMFSNAGKNAEIWSLNLSGWNLSKAPGVYRMFHYTGCNSTTFELNLTNWNVSNISSFSRMFENTGQNVTNFSIIGLSDWNVSNVTSMNCMFWHTGDSAKIWSIGDLSNWNTSNVTTMDSMFDNAGASATNFNIGDISNWDVSNVTNMAFMFTNAGRYATTWNIGDISKWNTSNVTNMGGMLQYVGVNATYSLDLSSWDVSKVTSYGNFNNGVTNKITSPVWNTSS